MSGKPQPEFDVEPAVPCVEPAQQDTIVIQVEPTKIEVLDDYSVIVVTR